MNSKNVSVAVWGLRGLLLVALVITFITFLHFPTHVDDPFNADVKRAATTFYEDVYASPGEDGEESEYVQTAREVAEHMNVDQDVAEFVDDYRLKDKRVLEIGAGSGSLQDLVDDYTGLDIAESTRRFFHKPFVKGSATALPFKESEFDAIWTVWVLEHVPNPERALLEMRRVLKHRGVIYLAPAWNCNPWAAEGYEARPYEDFDWSGKIIKASIPVRKQRWFKGLYLVPIRSFRLTYELLTAGPMRLRYRALDANFEHYRVPDSDAVNSIDCYETFLWFTSRGDQCLNCTFPLSGLFRPCTALIIEVNKPTDSVVGRETVTDKSPTG